MCVLFMSYRCFHFTAFTPSKPDFHYFKYEEVQFDVSMSLFDNASVDFKGLGCGLVSVGLVKFIVLGG